MAIDNATESSAVFNFGHFPNTMLPFITGSFGPEESAPLLGTYGEAQSSDANGIAIASATTNAAIKMSLSI